MNDKHMIENESLVNAWISHQIGMRDADDGPEETAWASIAVIRISLNKPEEAWDFVLSVYRSTNDEWVLENLGAGPIENLLLKHGEFAIPKIEAFVKNEPDFLKVLESVWPDSLPPAVAARFKRLF